MRLLIPLRETLVLRCCRMVVAKQALQTRITSAPRIKQMVQRMSCSQSEAGFRTRQLPADIIQTH